jgi:hypothetical protein
MGHAIARLRKTTPSQALLEEVERSAGALAWLDEMVASAPDDDALAPGGSHHHWIRERQVERAHIVKAAKVAHDAGIDERLVQAAELHVRQIGQAINRVIERLGLSDEMMMRARGMIRTELLALEASAGEEVEMGEVIEESGS